MADYAINVRAKVTATRTKPDASGAIEGWEVYDYDETSDPNVVVVRCDQLVRVEADNEDEAVEKAQAAATAIEMEDHEIDDVDLWVDRGVDINPEFADTSAPSP